MDREREWSTFRSLEISVESWGDFSLLKVAHKVSVLPHHSINIVVSVLLWNTHRQRRMIQPALKCLLHDKRQA